MKTIKLLQLCGMMSLSLFLWQCSDLEEEVFSQSTEDTFFQNVNDIQAALTGMYRPMQTLGGYQQAGHFILNGTSDEGKMARQWGTFDRLDYTPLSNGEINDWWRTSYQSISGANLIIDNKEKIENLIGDDSKAVVAEAKFLRAVIYFQLVQMYGGVPLRVKQVRRADGVNIARSTEEEVYDQIIADFEAAEEDLPPNSDPGVIKKSAATAYLAKVYLTRNNYPKALEKATEVVNSGAYGLAQTFSDVFDIASENGSEDIFTIQYVRSDGQGMRLESLTNAWGLGGTETDLYYKYDPTDSRRSITFLDDAIVNNGTSPEKQGKYVDPDKASADGQGNNFIVYRYADLLLIKAEAENEANGPTTAAYAEINKVRSRANLPNLASNLSKDEFREAVWNERNLELAMEEIRWYDLKRAGRLESVLSATGATWNDKYLLFPIPQQEIDASNGLITQNPGY